MERVKTGWKGRIIKLSGSRHIIVSQIQDKEGKKLIHIKFSRPVNRKDFCCGLKLNRGKSSGHPQYLHHGRIITELVLSEEVRKEAAYALCSLLDHVVMESWSEKGNVKNSVTNSLPSFFFSEDIDGHARETSLFQRLAQELGDEQSTFLAKNDACTGKDLPRVARV